MKPTLHSQEMQRLATLHRYDILDTPQEAEFDEVVRVVSALCDAPIAVITFIDAGRQWFKAERGLGVRETPLDPSICAHAILQQGLFVVRDMLRDERFSDNPLVTGGPRLRFYAGVPLASPEGLPLGTVCVLDTKPRDLTDNQKALLSLMANQVMKMLELRRANALERTARITAEALARDNAMLARECDHRVMNSLQLVLSVLGLQARNTTSDEVKRQLDSARNRVLAIATVHQQLHLTGNPEDIALDDFLIRLCDSLKNTAPAHIESLTVRADTFTLRSDLASTVGLVVAELVTNSFRHAYPEGRTGAVAVTFKRNGAGWTLAVADTGVGLAKGFDIGDSQGIGMRVVSTLLKRLDARLSVDSGSAGTIFSVFCDRAATP